MRSVALFLAFFISSCSNPEPEVILEENSSIAVSANLTENIGIEIFGGAFAPIIEKGSPVPSIISKTFSTAEDNQDQLTIAVFRGLSKMAKENTSLGKFKITGFNPEKRGMPAIQVTFGVSKKKIWIEAKDLHTNRKLKLEKL